MNNRIRMSSVGFLLISMLVPVINFLCIRKVASSGRRKSPLPTSKKGATPSVTPVPKTRKSISSNEQPKKKRQSTMAKLRGFFDRSPQSSKGAETDLERSPKVRSSLWWSKKKRKMDVEETQKEVEDMMMHKQRCYQLENTQTD
uniref:Uncharacterized protein n=1 Tax=Haemonchus contortus TaxID=6289 RepID=A0A7I4YG82_HAECO